MRVKSSFSFFALKVAVTTLRADDDQFALRTLRAKHALLIMEGFLHFFFIW